MGRLLKLALFAGQLFAVIAGVWITNMALTYKPYIVCGDLMCSFGDEYYRVAPGVSNGDSVEFDLPSFVFQLALILWVTLTVVLLLRRHVSTRAILLHVTASAIGVVAMQAALVVIGSRNVVFFGSQWTFLSLLMICGIGTLRLALNRWCRNPVSGRGKDAGESDAHTTLPELRHPHLAPTSGVASCMMGVCSVLSLMGVILILCWTPWLWFRLQSEVTSGAWPLDLGSCVLGASWTGLGLIATIVGCLGSRSAAKESLRQDATHLGDSISRFSPDEILLRGSRQSMAANDELLTPADKKPSQGSDHLLRPHDEVSDNEH